MKRFEDLVIVEIGGSLAGAYCGKLFADAGATVVVVGQDSLTAHERSYLHSAKECSASFDASQADVIIESSAPAPLEPVEIDAPQAVRVQISPYGSTGPRAHWIGTDLTDYAVSGHLYLYGDPNREPLLGPANQPAYASGLFGFVGAMAALFAREQTDAGQVVEVSHVEAMVALHQFTLIRYLMSGDILKRMGNRFTGQGQPNGLYPCADGWVSIAAPAPHQVEYVLAATGLTHLLGHPCIDSPMDFQSHPQMLDKALCDWLHDKSRLEVTQLFQTMRIPTGPALSMLELLDDPQLADREFFDDHDGVKHPSRPYRISNQQTSQGQGWVPGDVAEGPLAGLKVLDLTRVWAGPLATRVLSDLGAEVVWVEAPWARGPQEVPDAMVQATRYFPDDEPGEQPWNRNAHLVKYALGKKSLAIDLDTDDGRRALEALIPEFDVIVENYSPRVMPNLGFDEDRLHELNPDIMYVTMPGFGRNGPAEHWVAYGSSVDSHAGLSSLMGYADRDMWKGGVAWPDPIAGLHATSALLACLWRGRADGSTGGMTIELAQLETTIAALGDRIVEAQSSGVAAPTGNRDVRYVAQGVYPCLGDDRWLALSVVDDAAWQALSAFSGIDDAAACDHDRLDELLAEWTATYEAEVLAAELQAIGVPCAPVADASDVMADPHLRARGLFVELEQPQLGSFTTPLTPVRLSATPARVRSAAPTLGQHNADVLAAAGLSADAITDLTTAGVIANEPPN